MLSRIIAVADTYDVLTARDSYREPVSSYEAMAELRRVRRHPARRPVRRDPRRGARRQGLLLPPRRGRGLRGRAGARPADPRIRDGRHDASRAAAPDMSHRPRRLGR